MLPSPFGIPLMKFRLTYEGPLKAAANHNRRSSEKWALREAFHPQLSELWETHHVLSRLNSSAHKSQFYGLIDVGGKPFLPLIRKSACLACSLNILFLRKEEPGSLVLQGGDLDNRIKTLFDGLRMPEASELKNENPTQEPFCTLLEQDSLITAFSVDSDRVLTRPGAPVNEVHLVIEVTVRVMKTFFENLEFLGE
jgi:hypothetical protein